MLDANWRIQDQPNWSMQDERLQVGNLLHLIASEITRGLGNIGWQRLVLARAETLLFQEAELRAFCGGNMDDVGKIYAMPRMAAEGEAT